MDAAFVIDGEEFPIPVRYRLGDAVLVQEVSGLDLADELAPLLETGEWITNTRAIIAVIAVAVWQKRQAWSREKVIRWVERVDQGSLEWKVSPPEDDALPPEETEAESPSASSSDTSTTTAAT